jgi:4-hydroxythreonine-4-phosphate dehydrogenase
MSKSGPKPVIGITMGDAAGIGPEICLTALNHAEVRAMCTPVLFGDPAILTAVAKQCRIPLTTPVIALATWQEGYQAKEPVIINTGIIDTPVQPGKVQSSCGWAAYLCIEAAADAAMKKQIAAMATAPIHKEALRLAGITHPGHTEILTALTHASRTCMMLTSDAITVSLATIHIPLRDVPASLSVEKILDVIELTADTMRRMRQREPRLTVCGLNPHGGEHGLFGDEETRLIEPAVAEARRKGLDVTGPLAPDTAFIPERRAATDAYIVMYHDQGLIPFKMLAFETGVNVTLGLPIIRTSVDHGTAFDIAWQGKASAASLIAAIRTAVQMA